jgi:hypothetical protein
MGDGLLPIISNMYTIVIKIFVKWFGNLWVPRKKKKSVSGVAVSGSVTLKKKISVSAWN